MLEVTDMAIRKIKEHLAQNKVDSPVRVIILNSCVGPSLSLALDERKETDAAVELEGLSVVIDQELMGRCGAVKVDFIEPGGCGCSSGFSITSTMPLSGGSGCGGSCSSSGCGG